MIIREFGGISGLLSDCLSDCPVTSLEWSHIVISWGDTPVTSWGDTPHPRSEKPQQDGRHWSGIPHVQGQRTSPSKTVEDGNPCTESNPIPSRDAQRAQTNPWVHQDPGTLQRLRQNFLSMSYMEVWVSSGLPQGQELWVQQTWVWHKPSWRTSPLIPPQSCQNLHRTGG